MKMEQGGVGLLGGSGSFREQRGDKYSLNTLCAYMKISKY